ncbi:MAG: kinase [Betaproteobacteria bacterium]|nr:kinase [Betaproteobacteria bacterium]
MIISRTPFRVSFFGGGSDYPQWYRQHGGAVLATAIDKYCYISCRKLPPFFDYKHRLVYRKQETVNRISEIEHPAVRGVFSHFEWEEGVEIHHDGDLPARSGLGSSSSFTVGLISALRAMQGRLISKEELGNLAIHIEQEVIKENVGSQDQITAAYGGFNRIAFHRDGSIDVQPIILPAARLAEFKSHLMLVFTGFARLASEVAKTKIDNLAKRADEIKRITRMVDEGVEILAGNDPLKDFGALLHEAWTNKRKLSDAVSTEAIDRIYADAREAGAIGGKLLGAGGGGFMLLFVPPAKQDAVRKRLGKFVHVPFDFEMSGSRIVVYQPNGL